MQLVKSIETNQLNTILSHPSPKGLASPLDLEILDAPSNASALK
jgi:hypothetical protein